MCTITQCVSSVDFTSKYEIFLFFARRRPYEHKKIECMKCDDKQEVVNL